jgi:hypothetical protein
MIPRKKRLYNLSTDLQLKAHLHIDGATTLSTTISSITTLSTVTLFKEFAWAGERTQHLSVDLISLYLLALYRFLMINFMF